MFIDDSIKLDFEMPKSLDIEIANIETAFQNDDSFYFTVYLDDVEAIAKQCAINGSISYEQLNAIFRRYGLR